MKKTILILFIWAMSQSTMAQDAHYWTEQFGNRSMLLSGAVIGSVDDLGAVFYNPARLALQEDPTFLISAQAYEFKSLKVKEGFGDQTLTNENFGSAPSLAAGSFKVKFLPGHNFSYAFLSRYNVDYSLGAKYDGSYDFNPSPLWPGEEELSSSLSISKQLKDDWMGFSWSYKLNEYWSVGVSNFISQVSQTNRYELIIKAFGSRENVAAFERIRVRNYNATSWLAKIGFNYEREKVSIGLSITTPKVLIFGDGNSTYEESLAGYDRLEPSLTEGGDRQPPNGLQEPSDDILLSNYTSDVSIDSKSPLSIGLGMGIKLGVHKIHISGEWFNSIDRHVTMTPAPFIGQTPQIEIKSRVFDERRSVINAGIGMEWKIKEKLSGYTSFSTDFSSLVRTEENKDENAVGRVTDGFNQSAFTANVYNYGFGVSFFAKKMEFTIGTVYSRGSQKINKIVSLPGESPDPNVDPTSDVLWQRIRIILGFSLPFYSFGS